MIDRKDIVEMLSLENEQELQQLFAKAYQVKLENVGNKVYYRGIVEFSNICTKNCHYCGIRKGNKAVERYEMTDEEILEAAMWAYESHYGSIVLQSGERSDEAFVNRITNLLHKIKEKSNGKLGITLSVGEQTRKTFEKWYQAGAHRYLLRIETTNKELYEKFHPDDHLYDRRLQALRDLKKTGWQTGTGVLIGLPGQTVEHLADDILFFKEFDVDMIGMGPYIVHKDTPMNSYSDSVYPENNLNLALKMIAAARIVLKDINIASTTALQAINPTGRELGLKAGANIIMPVITDIKYRTGYLLYEGKPCLDENASQCRSCLERRIASAGETVGYDQWGDSPHYLKKNRD